MPGFSFAPDAEGRLPTSGPGVTVLVNGTPAPLLYVSATQINLQVPYEVGASGEAEFVVVVNGVASMPVRAAVQAASPGLSPIIYNDDGAANSSANRARPGSIITLYATGTSANSDDIAVSVGGRRIELVSVGEAPGAVGVIQMKARIPADLPEHEAHGLVLSVGGAESQAGVSVAVGVAEASPVLLSRSW